MRFGSLLSLIEEADYTDGAVRRDEFDQDYPSDTDLDAEQRVEVESFVFERTPVHHRYTTARGQKAIVYFDVRGRATSAPMNEIANDELVWLARTYGWDKAEPKRTVSTRALDHGYREPVQE